MQKYYNLNVDKLQRIAFQKGFSLSGLCVAAGINRSRVSDWKRHNVTPATVKKLADVLGCEPVDLVIGGDE